jgi:hypothetical protein
MKATFLVGVIGLLAITAAGPATSASPYRIKFGLFQRDGKFTESRNLPMRPHQGYGWIATVPPEAYVHWREILTVPKPPRTWGGLPSFDSPMEYGAVSKDRRTGVIEGDLPPIGGHIMHAWEVAVGDPSGPYVMSVILDGHKVGSTVFTAR